MCPSVGDDSVFDIEPKIAVQPVSRGIVDVDRQGHRIEVPSGLHQAIFHHPCAEALPSVGWGDPYVRQVSLLRSGVHQGEADDLTVPNSGQ